MKPILELDHVNYSYHSLNGETNALKDISFTVAREDAKEAVAILKEHKSRITAREIEVNDTVAKVSIVGAGMQSNPGVASRMFEALYNAGINIRMIATSEIRITVLINEEDVDKAMRAVHDQFIED